MFMAELRRNGKLVDYLNGLEITMVVIWVIFKLYFIFIIYRWS
jgi:hypothetical protein